MFYILSVPDTGVEIGVEEIYNQVDQDKGDGDEEHAPLHQGIVTLINTIEDHPADPRQAVNLFDDDCATEQQANLHTHYRDDWDEGVLERMDDQGGGFAQAFGAGGADI